MNGCVDSLACAVACCDGDVSQQPMWPHRAQRRRWNHQPPVASHSTQPVPLGLAATSTHPGAVAATPSRAVPAIPHHRPEEGKAMPPETMEPGAYGTDGTDPEEA